MGVVLFGAWLVAIIWLEVLQAVLAVVGSVSSAQTVSGEHTP